MTRPEAVEWSGKLQTKTLLQPQEIDGERFSRRKFLGFGLAVLGLATAEIVYPGSLVNSLGFVNRSFQLSGRILAQLDNERRLTNEPVGVPQPPNPIYFTDSLGRARKWFYDNATRGIPPNDPSRVIGTVYDYIDDVYSLAFQPKAVKELYPEILRGPGVQVLVGSVAVDVPVDRGYLVTATSRKDGPCDPHMEVMDKLNSPRDGNRYVVTNYLPRDGTLIPPLMNLGPGFLELAFVKSINPAEDGIYRAERNDLGDIVGDFVKVGPVTPTPTLTPTSTLTPLPSPSPTATRAATPTATPFFRYRALLLGKDGLPATVNKNRP